MIRTILRLVLILLAVGSLAAPARPAGALQQPYRLHIVLHVAPHRLLTPVFRDRVERELRDSLQESLGELGRVKLSRTHPMLERVLERGLQHGLENWKTRADVKTHFVLIDFNGSEYEIQARQHDGATGLVSPCVRRDRTRDRDFVAKAAALLIAHDFGLLGTVLDPPNGQQQVKVELRGGGLASLAAWVRKGDIFALVPPGGSGRALPWALLQVQDPPGEDARDGLCTCQLFNRYKLERSLAGYQCIKLGTVRAPLRLRWMRQEPDGKLLPLNGELSLSVAIRQYGFTGEEKTLLAQTVREDGVLDTTRDGDHGLFENVAFVSVTGGSIPAEQRPRVPVALVSDEPVIVPVAARATADNLLAIRLLTWQRAVADSLLVQITVFQEIKALSDKPQQRSQVLARAEEGLKRSHMDYESLTSEKVALERAAPPGKPLKLTCEENRLQELKEGEKLLEDFVQKQRAIEAEENNPKTRALRAQAEDGRLLENDLEIDRALEVYKKVLDEGFNDPKLKEHYEDLKKRWQPVSEAHRKARRFVYHDWPSYDTVRLKEKLPEARQAFLECKGANDLFTIRKLFKGCEAHAIQLAKEQAQLNPDLHTEDDKQAKILNEISKELIKLAEDIDAFFKEKG